MCNALDRQQIMREIHDPDFRLNKRTLKDLDEQEDTEYKFTIYQLDQSKKGFVGQPTTEVLTLALEEIFYRMVVPSDGVGPAYVGKIEPRHRFPDLSHPSQLQGDEFLTFMGAGTKFKPAKLVGTQSVVPHFHRRPAILQRPGPIQETLGSTLVAKAAEVNIFQHDLSTQLLTANQKMQ